MKCKENTYIPTIYEYHSSTSSHQLMIDIKHQPDTVLVDV